MGYKLGVIGGMGPKATSVFMDKVIEKTVANSDQEHIDMLILNHASLPDRTEIILNEQEEMFLEMIKRDFQLLEGTGIENIAIPCNTSHYFFKQLQAMTSIHIINMVEETVKEVYKRYGSKSKVGLLATKGTIHSGVYERSCQDYNIDLYIPPEHIQEQMMDIIYEHVKGALDLDGSHLEKLIKELVLKEGCDSVILACTELSCLPLSSEVAAYTLDAMEVLVERAIQLSGKEVKQSSLTLVQERDRLAK